MERGTAPAPFRRVTGDQHSLTDIDRERKRASCSVCGPDAPVYCTSTRSRGEHVVCKYASNASHRRTLYGLQQREYDLLLISQAGRCALCLRPPMGQGRYETLRVDHCHGSGEVRVLLCNECNLGLGKFHDDIDTLRRAIALLQRKANR